MFSLNFRTVIEILEQISDGLLIVSDNFEIKYINSSLAHFLDYDKKELLHKKLELITGEDNPFIDIIKNYIDSKDKKISPKYEGFLLKKNNSRFEVDFSLKVTLSYSNEFGGVIVFINDVTYRKEIEEKIRINTMKDFLTGLNNQNCFFEVFEKEVEIAKRYNRDLSLLYIDFDNFKKCNDKYGHQFGDKVLKYCSEIINNSIRKSDTMYRYGGDEFVILAPEVDLENTILLVKKIMYVFEEKTKDLFKTCPDDCKITISVGISQLKKTDFPDEFLKRADLAMYEAKKINGFSYIVS